jgi:hypothetical protein
MFILAQDAVAVMARAGNSLGPSLLISWMALPKGLPGAVL